MSTERCDVLVTSPLHPAAEDPEFDQLSVHVLVSPEDMARWGARVVIARDPIPTWWLEAHGAGLSGIVRHGTGTDYIPTELATQMGVIVANLPDVNPGSVAEHAIALILAMRRDIPGGDRLVRTGAWRSARTLTDARRLSQATVGIIGTGAVASGIVARLGGWETEIMFHSPSGRHVDGYENASLEHVLARSDVVILTTSLRPETEHLIDRTALSHLAPGALLVNVSRGGLLDQEAAFEALRGGRLGGLAMDVYEREPYSPPDSVTGLRVIFSPHVAGGTQDDVRHLSQASMRAALDILGDRVPPSVVNPSVLPRWQERIQHLR